MRNRIFFEFLIWVLLRAFFLRAFFLHYAWIRDGIFVLGEWKFFLYVLAWDFLCHRVVLARISLTLTFGLERGCLIFHQVWLFNGSGRFLGWSCYFQEANCRCRLVFLAFYRVLEDRNLMNIIDLDVRLAFIWLSWKAWCVLLIISGLAR